MNTLVYNAIRTPDGTVLVSRHRHDYCTHDDKNGHEYMVDGGLDYARRNIVHEAPHEELSVYLEDGHERVREVLSWGTYGKNGNEPLRYILLKDMDTDHIKACLATQRLRRAYRTSFEKELEYRQGKQ